jgi:hypothetical protein
VLELCDELFRRGVTNTPGKIEHDGQNAAPEWEQKKTGGWITSEKLKQCNQSTRSISDVKT